MGSYTYWSSCRWRFAHICLVAVIVGLFPSFALAGWSANTDKPLSDPQRIKAEMKLTTQIQLYPGENDVTFFGEYKKNAFTFVKQGNFGHLRPNPQPKDVPQSQSGEIIVLEGASRAGCPVDIFLPSANDQSQSWSLMPLGSYDNALPGWAPYSDNPNCGKGPEKTIEFYQGTLENIPTTFMLTAARHDAGSQTGSPAVYDIQVWAFTTFPEAGAGPPPPRFGLFGHYTTAVAYTNSAVALSSELAPPASKRSVEN